MFGIDAALRYSTVLRLTEAWGVLQGDFIYSVYLIHSYPNLSNLGTYADVNKKGTYADVNKNGTYADVLIDRILFKRVQCGLN